VLGVMRCDWADLASITGVAVTPVVAYMGQFEALKVVLHHPLV
jgi:hypothetical protein